MTMVGAARDTAARDGPYVGLNFYTQENAAMFFGRDTERTVLISNLRAARLTLLYAESGAGKSSLLRAGVAARLGELARRGLRQRGSARNIPVVFSSWRDDPTDELIKEIQQAVVSCVPGAAAAEFPQTGLEEAVEAASQAGDATLLVMLDQFEEYFLYRSREARAGRFADEVAACVNRPGLHANFLISIREDAYSGLGDLFKSRIPNVYGNYLHLEHLSRECARLAIEKPIASFNELHEQEPPVEIEPALVDNVLDQLRPDQFKADAGGVGGLPGGNGPGRGGDGIAAPYLQLVMKRLWEKELARGSRTLRLATLQELGGAHTIVRTHVDRALGGLADDDREAAADILRHLVTPSGTKIALAASDLADYTGRSITETSDLLEQLTGGDTRILRPVPPAPGGGERRFEISHDLLAPTIVDWGRRERAARLEQEKKAAEQQAQAEKQHAQAEKSRALRFRALAIGSAVLLVLAVFLLAYTFIAEGKAKSAKHEAEVQATLAQNAKRGAVSQRNQAISAQVAGESEALVRQEPLIGSQLAVAAWSIAPTREAHVSMLNALAQPDQGVLFTSPGHVNSVAFSPDGETLAAAGAGGTARLWDLRARRLIYTFWISHTSTIPGTFPSAVAFSPNGRTLATADSDGTARLWDLTRVHHDEVGSPLLTGSGRVTDLAFSPGGNVLATAGTGGNARLWNVRTHHQIHRLKASHTGALYSVAFSRDGKSLATGGADGTARLWNVHTGHQIHAFKASRTGAVLSVALSPDGQTLATAGTDGTAQLWNVHTGHQIHAFKASRTGAVLSVALSPDGQTLATAGADGIVRLWNVATRQQLTGPPVTASAIPVYSVAFSPDGKMLATGHADGTARLWNTAIYREAGPSFRAGRGAANSVVLSGNSKIIATGDADGTARLWNVRTHRQIHVFRTPGTTAVNSIALSPDGKTLATGDADGTARLWNVQAHRQLHTFRVSGTAVNSVAFSPNGKTLATAGVDGAVRLWNVATDRQVGSSLTPTRRQVLTDVAFSPQGSTLVTANADGQAQLWNVATQRIMGEPYTSNLRLESVAFSPDGKTLATAGDDGTVRLWNDKVLRRFGPGRSIGPPLTASGPIYAVAFSPDGHTLATAGSDGTARLWDVATRHEIGVPLRAGPGRLTDVVFSHNGRTLATTSSDGTTRLWNLALPHDHLVDHICSAYHSITARQWGTYISHERFRPTCPPASER
jgi:WD40 repeat protein